MKKLLFPILLLFSVTLLISGCLTIEKKEYVFEMNEDGSGVLTIKYVNIMSVRDDTTDVSAEDFAELISSYLNGSRVEEDFNNAELVSKRLFVEEGVLCGEVVFNFTHPSLVRLYRYENKGPYMFCINCTFDNESYALSNGSYGGEIMPVVFFGEELDRLELVTAVTVPDESTVSLLSQFMRWEASQE